MGLRLGIVISAHKFVGSGVIPGIYTFGGVSNSGRTLDASFYTPDTWTAKADMIGRARHEIGAAMLSNKIYAYGGDAVGAVDTNDEYTPDTWAAKTSMLSNRNGHAGCAIDSKAYSFFGNFGIKTTDEYSPDAWTNKADGPDPARYSCSAAALNSKAYVAGGVAISSYLYSYSVYDASGNSWASAANMLINRSTPGIVALGSNLYAMAGYYYSGGSTYLRDCDEYSVSGNSWSSKTDCPAPGRNRVAAAGIDGKGYLVLGAYNDNPIGDTDEYDASGNSWTSKTDGTAVYSPGASAI